ncbi:MAG: AAA family ATPase [Pseudomonadota bacterium]
MSAAEGVRLTQLTLSDFRNYGNASLSTGAANVVFTGPNGAGKTNILEAISLLSPGRGLRRASYGDMGRRGTLGAWSVFARLARGGEDHAVGTGVAPNVSTRQVRIDGNDARADDLMRLSRILWLTPAMDGLFPGPAADRRRFMDRMALALHPDHGKRANAYERAMRQRNKMFEEGARDARWFDAAEREMATHGAALAGARVDMIVKLNAEQAVRAEAGADFPQALLGLSGDDGDADAAAFAARLAANGASGHINTCPVIIIR